MICVLFYVKASYLGMVQRFNKFGSAVTDKSKSETAKTSFCFYFPYWLG